MDNNQKRILIVEDERALREMYAHKFRLEGFSVVEAADGEQGLATCEAEHPDLILLDIRMPIMNGDEMLEKLRSQAWSASIRVVILTNISRDEDPAKLRYLDVDRYVVKAHHTPTQILDIVNDILQLPPRQR